MSTPSTLAPVTKATPSRTHITHAKPLPLQWQFLCGAVAGGVELSIMYPLDLAKTRQQLVDKSGSAPKSVAGIMTTIVRQDGALRLYRGLLAPLSVEPLKRAWKFGIYGSLRRWTTGGNRSLTQSEAIICGAISGGTEAILIGPSELTKVRMMAPERLGKYHNSVHCARLILSEEGVRGFSRGLGAAVLRNLVWNSTYFGLIFNFRKNMWTPTTKSQELSRNFVAGTMAGIIGTMLNCPFDVVTSRMRNVLPGEVSPYKHAIPSLLTIGKNEGFLALYRGFPAKVARLGPGGGILLMVVELMTSTIRKFIDQGED